MGDRIAERLQVPVHPLQFSRAPRDPDLKFGVQRPHLRLSVALRGEIGQDQAPQQHAVEVETADRQQGGNGRAAGPAQLHFAPGAVTRTDVEQTAERGTVSAGDQVKYRGADQVRADPAGHRAQTRVGVQDDPPGGDRGRAFVHRLHDEAVGTVGTGEAVDLLLSGRPDHQRVDLTAPDRLDRLGRLPQLGPHLGQLGRLGIAFPGLSRRGAGRNSGIRNRRPGHDLNRPAATARRCPRRRRGRARGATVRSRTGRRRRCGAPDREAV